MIPTISSICSVVITSGGHITRLSRMPRTISPFAMQASRAIGPAVPSAPPKRARVVLSATISTAPDDAETCWLQAYQPMEEIELREGATLSLKAMHQGSRITVVFSSR